MTRFLLCLLATAAFSFPSLAQEVGKTPIDVSASQALEWHRADGYVLARGDAIVTHGTDKLQAPLIKAFLSKGSTNKIDHIEASGGITLTSANGQVSGPNGTYDVNTGIAVVSGGPVTLVSPEQTVTAKNQMTYDSKGGVMTATGAAKAVRKDGTVIEADTLVAHFQKQPDGSNKLSELEGKGNLKLTTATEVLTAGRGIYKAAQNKAFVYENVKIVRGQNTIEGDRGETDLTTKVSNIYADQKGGQTTTTRVHGIFYQE